MILFYHTNLYYNINTIIVYQICPNNKYANQNHNIVHVT